MLKGNGLSKGIAIGKTLVLKHDEIDITDFKIDDIESELEKLDSYINQVIDETNEMISNLSLEEREIMEAHIIILQDPSLVEESKRLIVEEKYNVVYAIENGFNSVIKMFEAIDDEYLSARSRDIADLKKRVLEKACGIKKVDTSKLPKNTILVSYELTTSDTAQLDFENISGIITEIGGATSHSCIIARTHGIPAISGVLNIYENIDNNLKVAMDGESGDIVINPSPDELLKYSKLKKRFEASLNDLEKFRGKNALTSDGVEVKLFANIGNVSDCELAVSNGASGIGLMRSEFLYMDSSKMPSEDEQFEAYKKVAELMKGKEVIIRTLDIGGDKKIDYIETKDEANPFLGCRAIRLCLKEKDLFKTQLRALLRASSYGDVAIMFPMISSIHELRSAKSVLEECKKELDSLNISYNKNIKVGIMIEIPSAAINADIFAKECDFFSIGTNDLIQYTVAVERGNEAISSLYTKFNPGVIKLIKMAIDGAHSSNIPCGMCGEAASDEAFIPLLVGMGLDEFSMSSNAILKSKSIISKFSTSECKKLVEHVLTLCDSDDIEKYLNEFISKK